MLKRSGASMKKIIILFGGKSGEHEVSIMSARNVYEAIDKIKFEVTLIYQTIEGDLLKVKDFESLSGEEAGIDDFKVDCVFPVMHGPNCEDGVIQGFLETLGVKYVGPKVLSSSLCMDKDIQKQIARFNNIPVTDWVEIKDFEFKNNKQQILEKVKNQINKEFNYPIFIKPCNMGSSVGITKVKSEDKLEEAMNEAFKYGSKIIIEKSVLGREIEIAVLGKGTELTISNPGEVVSRGSHEFYDYDAKYFDAKGSEAFIPAQNIYPEKIEEIKILSRKVYNLFECEGLSRIDFFLKEDGEIVLNEINTLPGFTNISMYPKLMQEIGINYTDLITNLIEL